MAFLYGKNMTKQEILDRCGDVSQFGGTRLMRFSDGHEDGVQVVEFRTGSGLLFHVVPGRGMDITVAEHNGRAMGWRSGSTEAASAFHDPVGLGWLRTFPGGLVTTCGLTYAGAPCEDDGESLGLHGRVSHTPATNLYVDGAWQGDDYVMWASGKMRETRLFGENILLERKISAVLGQNSFTIEDTVTNESSKRTPHMILYHINGGYPCVDAGSKLVSPTVEAVPRDDVAQTDKEHYYRNDPPTVGYNERCYYHDMATDQAGNTFAALINRNLPGGQAFGFYVKYNKKELPFFTQWKMNGAREYVVGMEPANCHVEGRGSERARGTLQFLKPGETRTYRLELGVLDGLDEVNGFEKQVEALK